MLTALTAAATLPEAAILGEGVEICEGHRPIQLPESLNTLHTQQT
jgi:hypothetical protein